MLITGTAPHPALIHEHRATPSGDLICLARLALSKYQVTRLLTSLSPGWEQALAKAAVEMNIPYTAVIPYPGRDAEWEGQARLLYLDLLARAAGVYLVGDARSSQALFAAHCWQIDHAEYLLTLWDFEFESETFQSLRYALERGLVVVNLWNDWARLNGLRRRTSAPVELARQPGAQVFECKA